MEWRMDRWNTYRVRFAVAGGTYAYAYVHEADRVGAILKAWGMVPDRLYGQEPRVTLLHGDKAFDKAARRLVQR